MQVVMWCPNSRVGVFEFGVEMRVFADKITAQRTLETTAARNTNGRYSPNGEPYAWAWIGRSPEEVLRLATTDWENLIPDEVWIMGSNGVARTYGLLDGSGKRTKADAKW